MTNDASSVQRPDADIPTTLLGRYLGSETAADEERRRNALRHREELRAGLARDLRRLEREQESTPRDSGSLWREVRLLRDGLAELRAEVRRIAAETAAETTRQALADELPEAVRYLITADHGGSQRNGTAETIAR
jgi:hypothetical protein